MSLEGKESGNAAEDITLVDVSCPVCGGGERTVFVAATKREPTLVHAEEAYVRCHDCGMIYLNPVPEWEEFKHYYERLSDFFTNQDKPTVTPILEQKGPAGWLYRRVFSFRPHAWPLEAGDGRQLLDVGCGDGGRLTAFAQRGWQVFGTDVSPSTIDVAQRTVPSGVFLQGEIEDIDLPIGSFDVVRLDNVLEHVPAPIRLLRRCRELLNSHGQLYIYVPHGNSLSLRLLRGHSYSAWTPFHLYLFTVASLERILLDTGFSSVEILHFSPHSWIPGSLKLRLGIAGCAYPYALDRLLMLACLPAGWAASKIGWGEELVAIARK